MRIVIVDDDALVAMSLRTILEADGSVEVVAVGADGEDAVRLYEEHRPDVLLSDIRMENVTGLCAAQRILEKHKDARILLLTTFLDDEYIIKALSLGVKGYILKQDFAGIMPAIKAVYEGQTVFGDKIVDKLPQLMGAKSSVDYESYGITDKEYVIIKLVAEGLNNKEIAEKEYLSEGTVRNYISTILVKLGLRDRTQLAIFYLNGK